MMGIVNGISSPADSKHQCQSSDLMGPKTLRNQYEAIIRPGDAVCGSSASEVLSSGYIYKNRTHSVSSVIRMNLAGRSLTNTSYYRLPRWFNGPILNTSHDADSMRW
jgi:hypothetical protein